METILDMTHQETRTPMPPQIRAGSGVVFGIFSVLIRSRATRKFPAVKAGYDYCTLNTKSNRDKFDSPRGRRTGVFTGILPALYPALTGLS